MPLLDAERVANRAEPLLAKLRLSVGLERIFRRVAMIEYIESESDKEITQFWIDRCLRLEAENNDLLAKIRTARDEEREECAKIVDHFKWWVGRQAKHEIATAIRMRSNV